MMTEVVLQIIIQDRNNMETDDLMINLEATANLSRTSVDRSSNKTSVTYDGIHWGLSKR